MNTHDVISETPVHIGDKVRFNPFKGIVITGFCVHKDALVTGKVIEIHNEHRWFAVEYMLDDVKQRTSFNFADVGHNVGICRRRKKED